MSILKIVNIQHPSSSTPAITLDSTGAMSGSFPYPNRNLLYNGAMQVHQRGTSKAGIIGNSYYTADRWITIDVNLGTWTQTVENDAPTGSGFSKSLKVFCTTADAAPAASDRLVIRQILEGQDLQRIRKGSASAQELTVSFWVKSNVTGTYVANLTDIDNTRHVSAVYTINASATWERKTITFPADTTGALDNDNAGSLRLDFYLAAGSDSTSGTLATVWAADVSANTAVGQTNLAAAVNNYWQVTGVQLETGPVATEFEFEPYATTLAKCQRYYEKSYSDTVYPGTNSADGIFQGGGCSNQVGNISVSPAMMVQKRAAPTISFYLDNGTANTWSYTRPSTNGTATPTAYTIGTHGFGLYIGVGVNWAATNVGGHWVASAEL